MVPPICKHYIHRCIFVSYVVFLSLVRITLLHNAFFAFARTCSERETLCIYVCRACIRGLCFAHNASIAKLFYFVLSMTKLPFKNLSRLRTAYIERRYIVPFFFFLLRVYLRNDNTTKSKYVCVSCVYALYSIYIYVLFRGARTYTIVQPRAVQKRKEIIARVRGQNCALLRDACRVYVCVCACVYMYVFHVSACIMVAFFIFGRTLSNILLRACASMCTGVQVIGITERLLDVGEYAFPFLSFYLTTGIVPFHFNNYT